MDVDRTADVPLKTRVEETRWVLQRRAFEEGEFHDALVSLTGADWSVVGPDRNSGIGSLSPLPLFDNVRIDLLDKFAYPAKGLSPPVPKLGDSLHEEL